VPFANSARRIDSFIASALLSFASEWIGAVVSAYLHTGRGCLSRRVKSSKVLSSRAEPGEDAESVARPGFSNDAPEATPKLKHDASFVVSRSEAVIRNELLLATKVAHEELGEKAAVFLGCAFALSVGRLSCESVAKAGREGGGVPRMRIRAVGRQT
jgi:hypothetical protein